MRTSYSALETYKICPLKYKYQEVDRIKGKKTKEQVFGTAVHKALNFMFKKTPLFPTLDEVLNFFAAYWDEARKKVDISDEEDKFYLEEGKNILKKFFTKNQPWNFNVLDLESRFEVLIDDPEAGENHILAGIIDRIDKPEDNSYEIIDYKTSRKMPSQDSLDKNLQLSIYNLGLIKRWPHIKPEEVKVSLYFLEHGEKISSKRTAEDLEDTRKGVLGTIREIKKREEKMDFPPTPGSWCDWCPYRQICPMWRHLYSKPEVPSDEEIKSVVKEYLSIKGEIGGKNDRIKMLQQKINQYLDEKGLERVFGEEGYVTRRISEKRAYDLEKAREILEPLGKWSEVLKADEKKLEGVIASLSPMKQKELEGALLSVRKTSTLTMSRKKSDVTEEDSKD